MAREQNRNIRKVKQRQQSSNLAAELNFAMNQIQRNREIEAEKIRRKNGIAPQENPLSMEEFLQKESKRTSWEFLQTEAEKS